MSKEKPSLVYNAIRQAKTREELEAIAETEEAQSTGVGLQLIFRAIDLRLDSIEKRLSSLEDKIHA